MGVKDQLGQIDQGVIDILSEATETSDNQSYRDKFKIDVLEEIPPPQIAWSVINKTTNEEVILGTLGDFGVAIGKAKARKSFFITLVICIALSIVLFLNRFRSYLPKNRKVVLYFDTEQSKYYVQKAVQRICRLLKVREPKNLHAYYLRSLSPSERLKFIEEEIYSNDNVSFVVIDGIKDLVTSINDEGEATMIASKLLKWSEERNIYILTVLHQNKSDNNARGHIGTELINKAQTVLSITKDEKNPHISIVEPQQCRDKEPESFAFEIDENGLPVIVEGYDFAVKGKKFDFKVSDLTNEKLYEILEEVFKHGESFSYSKLVFQVKIAYQKIIEKSIGDNTAKGLITQCSNNGWLVQEKPKSPYKLGSFEAMEKGQEF